MRTMRLAGATMRAGAVAALLALGACAAMMPGAGPAEEQPASGAYNFACDNGWVASIRYPGPDAAVLTVEGRRLNLYAVPAASGARYATEQGLTPHDGLMWWEKGGEARLYRMILDDSADAANYPVIAVCRAL